MNWDLIKQVAIGVSGIVLVLLVGFLVASPVHNLVPFSSQSLVPSCRQSGFPEGQRRCSEYCDNQAGIKQNGSLTLYNWDKNGSCICGVKE